MVSMGDSRLALELREWRVKGSLEGLRNRVGKMNKCKIRIDGCLSTESECQKETVPQRSLVSGFEFEVGEVYLFHPDDPLCPDESSLWGMFDRRDETGTVRMESSSEDLKHFLRWHPLSPEYRYCRLSTRAELRDYAAALAYFESRSDR